MKASVFISRALRSNVALTEGDLAVALVACPACGAMPLMTCEGNFTLSDPHDTRVLLLRELRSYMGANGDSPANVTEHQHSWTRIMSDLYGCECGARGHNTLDDNNGKFGIKECEHNHVR